MFQRLPTVGALVVYIDFAALRAAGVQQLLEGSRQGEKAQEEPEYRSFVAKTDFDWKQDLDAAMVAFAPTGNFMLVKGRFDWKTLTNYVRGQDGNCNNSFCRMQGSTPERRISFFPLQSGVMALAVSSDEAAALRMSSIDPRPDREIPAAPVWISIPPSIVGSGQALPEGTQMFARSLEGAQSVTLALSPQGDAFAARLDVRCGNAADAAGIAGQLTKATSILRELIAHENKQPNPADLSGFLTSGTFQQAGTRVEGHWPVGRQLIVNLLGGE